MPRLSSQFDKARYLHPAHLVTGFLTMFLRRLLIELPVDGARTRLAVVVMLSSLVRIIHPAGIFPGLLRVFRLPAPAVIHWARTSIDFQMLLKDFGVPFPSLTRST